MLNIYDPDRAQRYTQGGNTISKEKALDSLVNLSKEFALNRGAKVAFVMEQSSSPLRLRLQFALQQKYPQAKWAVYASVDLDANRRLTGSTPYYKLDAAKVILSLDADFVGTEADSP